jgi:hypothetical protein
MFINIVIKQIIEKYGRVCTYILINGGYLYYLIYLIQVFVNTRRVSPSWVNIKR